MKKIKKVVALLSIVSLLIATAFSASAVEANASYDPETNHATVLHNENQVIPVAGTTQLSQDEYKRTWASLTDNAGTAAEIQATCELFISSIYASRRDSDYNCTTFTVQSIRKEQVDSTTHISKARINTSVKLLIFAILRSFLIVLNLKISRAY